MTARHPRLATVLSARAAYVAIILFATMVELEPDWDTSLARNRFILATHPVFAWGNAVDGIRNVLLFAGFGAVWMVTARTGRLREALWRSTIYGALLSITVETLQLFSPMRVSSTIDVATNTAGTLLGAFGVALIVAAVRARRDARSYLGVPAMLLALGQLGAVFMEAFTPLFRQQYLPYVAGGPLTRLRTTLLFAQPASLSTIPLTDLLLSIPAGFLSVAALAEFAISRPAAAVVAAVIGLVLSIAGELLHAATGELVVWGAVVAHGAGIAAGALLASASLPAITQRWRGAARARAFYIAYAIIMMIWAWRPFTPRWRPSWIALQLRKEAWIPMLALAQRGDVFTVGHVIQLFSLAMPLGAVMEAWPLRRSGWLRWVLPAVWLTAVLEIGHIFVESRTFDVTNFLILSSGAWMGWWIVRRAGVSEKGVLG